MHQLQNRKSKCSSLSASRFSCSHNITTTENQRNRFILNISWQHPAHFLNGLKNLGHQAQISESS